MSIETYYAKNKDKILKRAKARYAELNEADRRARIEYATRWQRDNRAQFLARRRNRHAASERSWRAEIPERYALGTLLVGSRLEAKDIPPELISLQQTNIKLKRLIWQKHRASPTSTN